MALSDCEKCWDTPCECGYDYESWSDTRIKKFIKTLEGVLQKRVRTSGTHTICVIANGRCSICGAKE